MTQTQTQILTLILILIFLVLFLFIGWKIYEYLYYKGKTFKQLKNDLNDYIRSCNELNEHIEELKYTYTEVKQVNYGTAQFNDSSRYNFKRTEQKRAKKSKYIYDCSATVCKNAGMQPFKYLCKYFNIKPNEESLEHFENLLNKFSAAEEGKILLKRKLKSIIKYIKNDIPYLIRTFSMEKFMLKLGFEVIDFSTLYFPVYSFRYVSPGGNKSNRYDIILDIDNLNDFVQYLANSVKFRKSVAGQRALMTSKLREKIKKRDNYTCKKCGLSTRDERNLLLEIDHITPLSKGGLTTEDNLQTLCWKCNRKKGAKIYS